MILNKDSILTAQDLKRKTVDVPEWGEDGKVIISELSAEDRFNLLDFISNDDGVRVQSAKMLVFGIVDEQGRRVFENEEASLLAKKSLSTLQRLVQVFNELNKIEAKEGDEEKK